MILGDRLLAIGQSRCRIVGHANHSLEAAQWQHPSHVPDVRVPV